MNFSYNWLQSFFTRKLPVPQKLAQALTLHFAEVEEIKKVDNDFVLNIDVRPNRAGDCFSHLGVARECAALLNSKFHAPNHKQTQNTKHKIQNTVSVLVKNRIACPRYTAKAMTDVKVGPSPKWLRERLAVCGLNSINNVVDIANYVMLETGQPLHAFDLEKIEGRKIIVRPARKGEKIITLDNQRFDLDKDVLVIADSKKPIAIAGIKGGKSPEISPKTKTIVLEAANFNSKVIRRGYQKLNLRTDASLRFEHGLDPNLTEFAINRAADLIQKLAGGKQGRGLVDIYPKKVLPKIIKLNPDYVGSLLGVKIPATKIKNILTRLGLKIVNCKLKILTVEVPTRRLDVSIPEDLIEEIGRIYGYEKIPAVFPQAALVPPQRNEELFWEDMAKNILKEAGFIETYNYSFIPENDAKNFLTQNLIEIANPLSKEQKYLRPSLIPNLLKNIEKNQNSFNKIKIFELGRVFSARGGPAAREKRMLTGMMTGNAFYEAKGVTDTLLNKMGMASVWYDDYKPTPQASKLSLWQAGKCAEIKVDQTELGFLGELRGKGVVAFDIDFGKLQKMASEEHEYRPISKFPSAIRDIAVLVPREVRVEEVLNKIETAGGELVRDVDLFDIYEGEELPQNQKNLAFRVVYQSAKKTLEAREVDSVHQKIIKSLEQNPLWQVRK
jgi:phenylalanyl-tRNA synthetase beta chain